jgi:lambda repressor-like predicted transcriptional regulator
VTDSQASQHDRPSLRGTERQRVAAELARHFRSGKSIHALAEAVNRGPATVRRLLEEAGVRDDQALIGLSARETTLALAARRELGASLAQLANETGLDRRAVRRYLVDAGVELPRRGASPSMGPDALVERYQAGASLRTLAGLAGCSYRTVRNILLDAGVTLRQQGPRLPKDWKMPR